ncbi:hypothetical protein Geezett_075 [Klebsiella phage Geezett]|uniref:Uncharacterized protein n=1 Tax=Klebsiella phage Geezett TaxID=2861002 RepID=A0AAE7VJV3_9CAUD|nr:hypothetical protein PQZ59_gp75 [Klebsiella phage Geezett]QXV72147.1 hypothetical protein Geezett_075 [Klebsiella phage Geezett]
MDMETLSYHQLMERCLAAEARVVELAAENVALKAAIDATIGWQQSTDVENVESVRMLLDINTPTTDRIVAAQRSAFVDEAVAKITESGALTFGDCIVPLCKLREGTK